MPSKQLIQNNNNFDCSSNISVNNYIYEVPVIFDKPTLSSPWNRIVNLNNTFEWSRDYSNV